MGPMLSGALKTRPQLAEQVDMSCCLYVHPAASSGHQQVVGWAPLAVPCDAVSAWQAGPLIAESEA